VFFDTLVSRLAPEEVEAVLAHELGHFSRHHIWKRMGVASVVSLALLAALGWLMQQGWFYAGLGVQSQSTAMALVLFFMIAPAFTFLLQPLASLYSRLHEFEADQYARALRRRRRPGARAGEALRGQRRHSHAGPAALGFLRFAPARADTHRPAASRCTPRSTHGFPDPDECKDLPRGLRRSAARASMRSSRKSRAGATTARSSRRPTPSRITTRPLPS